MLNIALCDDEKFFTKDLKKIIGPYLELEGIDYQVKEFTCAEDFLKESSFTDFQILFLDIEMKEMDGITLAKKLREERQNMEIIFVTSHSDFVFLGYEVRAFNYILKPYKPEKITAVLKAALDSLEASAEKYFTIEQKGKILRLPLSSILYFVSDRRTVRAVALKGEYVFYDKLDDVQARLPDSFIRIHNRYLVHLKYVQAIRGNEALLQELELPVSRSYKSQLAIAFAKYTLH